MKRFVISTAIAFALLTAWVVFIVLTSQGPMPAAPSYLPQVDRQ